VAFFYLKKSLSLKFAYKQISSYL